MALSDVLYAAYARRLLRELEASSVPRHVGVMLDGNRRWAQGPGAGASEGHQAGADNIENLLSWCDEVGVEVVTLWLLSTDNLNRPEDELRPCSASSRPRSTDLAATHRWRIHPVGALDLLPAQTAAPAEGGRGPHP
jgi:short-chain Z-isoprenyl diphosphate synthase